VGLVWIPQIAHSDTLRRTCLFPSGAIYGHALNSCVFGARNYDTLFFMLGWAQCRFRKMSTKTPNFELMFCMLCDLWVKSCILLQPGCENVDALFFMLRWDWYGFHKYCAGTCYNEIVFFHSVRLVGHVLHPGVSGARNIEALFFMIG
jgi:hypothetical protein